VSLLDLVEKTPSSLLMALILVAKDLFVHLILIALSCLELIIVSTRVNDVAYLKTISVGWMPSYLHARREMGELGATLVYISISSIPTSLEKLMRSINK
jgi:hypothetical protein